MADIQRKKLQMLLLQENHIDISLEIELLSTAMEILNSFVDSLGNTKDKAPTQPPPVSLPVYM